MPDTHHYFEDELYISFNEAGRRIGKSFGEMLDIVPRSDMPFRKRRPWPWLWVREDAFEEYRRKLPPATS